MSTCWKDRLMSNPFGAAAASGAVVLGVMGAIAGTGVSRGMATSLEHNGIEALAHAWGVLLALGGALKLAGLSRQRSDVEIPGLWLMAGGYAFYTLLVAAGSGLGGFAAGTVGATLAVGCAFRVRIIMRAAKAVSRLDEGETGG